MSKTTIWAAFLCVAFVALPTLAAEQDDYKLGPDSLQRLPGVPQGKVMKLAWNTSKVFPGTTRDWWIYVPSQYDARTPACVMVFQDGSGYVSETGAQRLPIVFDNLISKKEMPVTIGIFINPGTKPAAAEGGRPISNRSFEYDTLSDQYARFLIEEILPEVSKTYRITDDPQGHAICGLSSGAICAFTVAWERPDVFRKVLSQIGSFTSIAYRPARDGQPMQPGGDLYPTLIRKTRPVKPIRVFLQDGSNDLDNNHGAWFLANQQMAAALKFSGYDYKTEWGHGTHNPNHGGAIMPDALRWLWRDFGKPAQK
ncbi:MAG TPA: alpha/beta hydrolase-fold protein [Humisphaera sp.]|nr:alpha/beta hydrolase-fold protein [Humisphaera sp.]